MTETYLRRCDKDGPLRMGYRGGTLRTYVFLRRGDVGGHGVGTTTQA